MPKLEAKIEGSGNGIKTVIPNMVEIARSLERPPSCTLLLFYPSSLPVPSAICL